MPQLLDFAGRPIPRALGGAAKASFSFGGFQVPIIKPAGATAPKGKAKPEASALPKAPAAQGKPDAHGSATFVATAPGADAVQPPPVAPKAPSKPAGKPKASAAAPAPLGKGDASFEALHPRDSHGRFADKGGGDSAPAVNEAVAKEKEEAEATLKAKLAAMEQNLAANPGDALYLKDAAFGEGQEKFEAYTKFWAAGKLPSQSPKGSADHELAKKFEYEKPTDGAEFQDLVAAHAQAHYGGAVTPYPGSLASAVGTPGFSALAMKVAEDLAVQQAYDSLKESKILPSQLKAEAEAEAKAASPQALAEQSPKPAGNADKAPTSIYAVKSPAALSIDHLDLHAPGTPWGTIPGGYTPYYSGLVFNEEGKVLLTRTASGWGLAIPHQALQGSSPLAEAKGHLKAASGMEIHQVALIPGLNAGGYHFLFKAGKPSPGVDPASAGTTGSGYYSLDEARKLVDSAHHPLMEKGFAVHDEAVLLAKTGPLAATWPGWDKIPDKPVAADSSPKTAAQALADSQKPAHQIEPAKQPPLPQPSPGEPPATVVDPPKGFPRDASELSGLVDGGSPGGSTGARVVTDKAGNKFILKRPGTVSPEHIRNEYHADMAYRALGVPAPDSHVYETPNGPVKLARWVEGETLDKALAKASPAKQAEILAKAQAHFHADVLLDNYDVAGTSMDNLLLGKDGKVYRIDNGSALKYRATGKLKDPDQWHQFLMTLWTLRTYPLPLAPFKQAARAFGGLGISAVADQILSVPPAKVEAALAALPPAERAVVRARRESMLRIARGAQSMVQDGLGDHHADDMLRHHTDFEKAGIPDRMSTKWTTKEHGKVEDEHGIPFDNLRGPGSTAADFLDRVQEATGHSGAKFISDYHSSQGASTQDWVSRAVQYWWYKQHSPSVSEGDYAWLGGIEPYRMAYDAAVEKYGAAVMSTSLRMLHAYTYQYLNRFGYKYKNQDGSIDIHRQENTYVIKQYAESHGLGDLSKKDGKVYPRNAQASYGMNRGSQGGTDMVVKGVPTHRVLTTYLAGVNNHYGVAKSPLYGDVEQEFVVDARGLKAYKA